jgi:streptogramin lyase
MGRAIKVLATLPAALACLCLAAEEVPVAGVKTPGVQIPFAKLKAEAEFEGSPAWLLFSDSVLMPAESGEALAKIDAKANKPGTFINGFSEPCAGAISAFKSVWVPNCGAGTISRLDPKTGEIGATIAAGVAMVTNGIAASTDSVWVLTDSKTTLSRIDPASNQVVAELRLPAGCGHLTFAETALWVTCPTEGKLLRISPITNLVEQRVEVAAEPSAIAAGDGSVWVLGLKEGKVDRIDPKTNTVRVLP